MPQTASDGILADLEENRAQAVQRISKQSSAADILARLDQIDGQMEQTAQIKDETQRNTRQRVLTAELETLREEVLQEEQDLSMAVLGLNALMEEMGKDYEMLQQPSQQELNLIANAEARLIAARQARQAVDKAWWRKAAKIEAAEAEIRRADQALTDTRVQVKHMARQRLMSASMEESLQEFMFKVKQTIEIMRARKAEIDKQIEAVGVRKTEALRIKELAAKKLEELDRKLEELEGQLRSEEESMTSLVNGSEEYVAQEKKVSELRRQVETIRGNRNTALVLFQSKERFVTELGVHEVSQIKLRDNQRIWITVLTSDTEERVATFRSRLEAMKAMSDQDVAQNLDRLGTEVDARNTEFMAKVGRASDDRRMKMIEAQPDRIRRLTQAQQAQAEAIALIREREAEALAEFRERWGIDPTASSFFSYEGGESQGRPVATSVGA